jgi:uncharacterized membrane protein
MLPLILVWFHLIAAISWIGGMVFLSLVLAPLLRRQKAAPELMALFRSAARRFRIVVWLSMGMLLSTGPMLLHARGILVMEPTHWPSILRIKLGLAGILLLLTFMHDLLLGPQVVRISAVPEGARTAWQDSLIRTSRWLPRLSLVLALAVLWAAVLLVRS